MPYPSSVTLKYALLLCFALAGWLVPRTAAAQGTSTVTGTVTRADEHSPLASVSVTVQSTGQSTVTGPDGRYTLRRVPEGPVRSPAPRSGERRGSPPCPTGAGRWCCRTPTRVR
jgi:hypothetical protein